MSKPDLTRSSRMKASETKGARVGRRAPIIIGARMGTYFEFQGKHIVLVHETQNHPDGEGNDQLWRTVIEEIVVASREDAHKLLKVLQ